MLESSRARLFIFAALVCVLAAFVVHSARAIAPSNISDVIYTSQPSVGASHEINFRVNTSIPVSGKILIIPESSAYTLPAGFDLDDIDLSISSGGPFADRSLAATASAADDGVSINTLTGVITITLNTTSGITAGDLVKIELGTNASFQATGDTDPVNPSVGSYRIGINTQDAGGTSLGFGKTMIAIIEQVSVVGEPINLAPIRSNGLPSGTVAANNSVIELSLNTDKPGTCKFSTVASTTFAAMVDTFTAYGPTTFIAVVSGHQNGTSYTYYVKCADNAGNTNTDDYPISFTLEQTPISNTSVVLTFLGRGGVGEFRNGSEFLYLASIRVEGWGAPNSTITILKDGVVQSTVQPSGEGRFAYTVGGLERGTYTITAYGVDSAERKSATFTSTLSIIQGSTNLLSDVAIAPTIALADNSVPVGEGARALGSTIPNARVELYVYAKSGGFTGTRLYTGTSTPTGTWDIAVPSEEYPEGTYGLRARVKTATASSELSPTFYLGIGEEPPAVSSEGADLNGDGKVNLIDFSIMLTNWGRAGTGDLNEDNTVNLADFSILLFNWTG